MICRRRYSVLKEAVRRFALKGDYVEDELKQIIKVTALNWEPCRWSGSFTKLSQLGG